MSSWGDSSSDCGSPKRPSRSNDSFSSESWSNGSFSSDDCNNNDSFSSDDSVNGDSFSIPSSASGNSFSLSQDGSPSKADSSTNNVAENINEVDEFSGSAHSLLSSQSSKTATRNVKPVPPKHHMDEEDFDESLISAAKIQALHFNPTQPNILFVGLVFAGFDSKRQRKVGLKRNTRRFLSFYGVEPLTIKALFADLRSSYPKLLFVNLMMTINWFKLYDSEPVLEGRWGFCAEYIGPKLKETSEMIQSLVKKKIKFEYDPEDVLIMTLDTVNYLIQEPRTTPSTCYFDPKSKSAGAKYEHGVSLTESKQIWLRGPKPAAVDDITFFRGGKTKESKDTWDKSALYAQLPPGKRVITDSGYLGEPEKVLLTKGEHDSEMKRFIGRAKARQESLHTRLKSFNILKNRFRHGKSTELRFKLHQMVVESICVIVQFDLENGHPLMDV